MRGHKMLKKLDEIHVFVTGDYFIHFHIATKLYFSETLVEADETKAKTAYVLESHLQDNVWPAAFACCWRISRDEEAVGQQTEPQEEQPPEQPEILFSPMTWTGFITS